LGLVEGIADSASHDASVSRRTGSGSLSSHYFPHGCACSRSSLLHSCVVFTAAGSLIAARGNTKPAVLPIRWPPGLSKAPGRLLDSAGKRECQRPSNRDLNLTFISFKRAEASSGDWPLTKRNRWNGSGTARKRQLIVASATYPKILFRAG